MDAADASVLGAFWSKALGLELAPPADGDDPADGCRLSGVDAAQTVWIDRVPEPKTVKHRVHIDIHGSSVAELEAIGASVIDDQSFRWIVMADPEGGVFCLFVRESPPTYRLYELAIDCVDHERMSAWWASVLGGRREVSERGYSSIQDVPNVPFDGLTFESVPEPKAAKNRVHFDVVAPSIDPIVAAGATMLRRHDDEIRWDVLADPEGNEFCVFPPL